MSIAPEKPLRPLSAHALAELDNLLDGPEPCSGINPGVVDRLVRGELAELVQRPSPYPTNKGKQISHLRITPAGHVALANRKANP